MLFHDLSSDPPHGVEQLQHQPIILLFESQQRRYMPFGNYDDMHGVERSSVMKREHIICFHYADDVCATAKRLVAVKINSHFWLRDYSARALPGLVRWAAKQHVDAVKRYGAPTDDSARCHSTPKRIGAGELPDGQQTRNHRDQNTCAGRPERVPSNHLWIKKTTSRLPPWPVVDFVRHFPRFWPAHFQI